MTEGTDQTDAPDLAVPVHPLAVDRATALGLDVPVRASMPLGTVDAAVVADIDPAGLVQLRGATWSLDWWIGAEDRWHHPSIDAAVRQHTIDGTPLVETAMRVPGGDIVQRVYGVRARSASPSGAGDDTDGGAAEWNDSAVVVEIENLTSVPVALAFAVRPVTLDGPGSVRSVEVDGSIVRVDGEVAAVVSRELTRRVSGTAGGAARRLRDGDDEPAAGLVEDATGALEAAVVVPLPHATTVKVLLPRIGSHRGGRPGGGLLGGGRLGGALLGGGRSAPVDPGPNWDAPDLAAATAGWGAHTRELAAVELPEPRIGELTAASEHTLMLAATDDFFDAGAGATAAVRAAELCDALVRVGISQPLEPIARALVDTQGLTGAVKLSDRSDATVALLHAVTPLLLGPRGATWADDLVGPAARAVHRLERGKGLDADLRMSAAVALGRLGPAMRAVDQPDVASAAEELSARLSREAPSPVGAPTTQDDLLAVTPTARALRAALGAVHDRRPDDLARITGDVLALLRRGTAGVIGDLVDDQDRSRGVRGLDPAAVAARLGLALDLAVLEGADGPELVPGWIDTWFGQPCEAHRIRTRWGLVSFAVRWHGRRPALLWEVDPGPGVQVDGTGPTLRARGLDPTWVGQGWEGEALLAEQTVPEAVVSLTGSARLSSPRRVTLPTSTEPAAPPVIPDEGESFA